VQRSIATTPPAAGPEQLRRDDLVGRLRSALERADPAYIGLFFVTLAIGIYFFSNPSRSGWYNHFVWQADAFLQGRFGIAYPVVDGPFVNGYFQDIMPLPSAPGAPSYGLLPFPPLPAVLLMPFVAIFGMATDAQLFGVVLGAINVGLAWRMTTRLTEKQAACFLATLFFAFGTVHWYAAIISTTWFLAHVVAITFLLLGITLALDAEQREQIRRALRPGDSDGRPEARNPLAETFEQKSLFVAWGRRLLAHVDGLQFMAGFVFGLAALSRLTIIFGAPFFVFVGGGGSYFKRALSAGIGAVIPVALIGLYNVLSTGHVFNPVYDWLFQQQFHSLPYAPSDAFYGERSWGPENPLYIPLNSVIMFLWPPDLQPSFPSCSEAARTFLGPCPIAVPSKFGLSILLTSPAYLLIPYIAAVAWRKRVVLGALLAAVMIGVVNLAHFSQGWVQFGYRFSNDFAPFALILVTLGIAWLGAKGRAFAVVAVPLVALSILVNAWGVYWGVTLGW
jgi:hypothetical protein